jgi:hypothetical protein
MVESNLIKRKTYHYELDIKFILILNIVITLFIIVMKINHFPDNYKFNSNKRFNVVIFCGY